MLKPVEKFQSLLRELFQFDCADLDFGIYRIMNHKREVIEHFIAVDLPKAIAEDLAQGALAEQSQAVKDLEVVRKKVQDALDEDALDADGNLAEKYRDFKAGKEYLAAQERAKVAQTSDALEAAIYNHLYAFFSRYWQEGDFISKRRYSKRERYAIPYNGEEVMLYWANHDQYYVKTGEYFTDYTWRAPNGVTVQFKLKAADVEQNNVKGEKRFFLPQLGEMVWDDPSQRLTIPFEFRPLTAQEAITYGKRNQQEAINAETVEKLTQRHKGTKEEREILVASCLGVRTQTADGKPVSYLEHHLRQYTRRNTSDFFIHKDLQGFLSRELDFYLKNEVLNLDELKHAGEGLGESWFQLLRLIKQVGSRIIEFLAQGEDFQKMLWEKRKFVTETFYCIAVGVIDEAFYPEIAACEAQWEEWKALFYISHEDTKAQSNLGVSVSLCEKREAFLKAHPTLVLDTRHFDRDFADRLLASFDDLDEMTDGLLVHSENWQALNLLQEQYRERVKQIHIDPPYNTDSSGFVYKNDYRHSSWLSIMMERFILAKAVLQSEGLFTCHIDENEFERLRLLFEQIFGYVGTAVWDKLNPMMGARELAIQHEYILFCASESRPFVVRPQNIKIILSMAREITRKFGGVTEQAKKEFTDWVRSEDYLLQYMLVWETRRSETLLNVEKLARPFAYHLHLHRDGETRVQPVDLPETFNYLIGLNVQTRQVYLTQRHKDTEKNLGGFVPLCENKYLVYRGVTREGRKVVVLWRETEGWTHEDYCRDRDFVTAHKLTEGADDIYVNGDSFIPGARALDGVFKERMFARVG